MINRIEVGCKNGIFDSRGNSVKKMIAEDLGILVDSVEVIDVYTLDMELTDEELANVKENLFTDPVIQDSTLNSPLAKNFDFIIEVGFKPGVTDNVGRSATEGISDLLKRTLKKGEKVFTAKQYILRSNNLTLADVKKIAKDCLANELIETITILDLEGNSNFKSQSLKAQNNSSVHEPVVQTYNLELSDDELIKFSNEKVLALSLDEMKAIREYFNRPEVIANREKHGLSKLPTDCELEAIAQTWSEHCKHKIFAAEINYEDEKGNKEKINSLFKTYIKKSTDEINAEWLESVFVDNAGVIRFNEDNFFAIKVETHNSPSALDPFGGAMTGIVGVNRDILGTGKGCKPILNTDVFCFGDPYYKGELPPGILHPRRIFKGVHRGVKDGGNESGIPVVNGSISFDDRFMGKPLVFCGTGGIMPAKVNGENATIKHIDPGHTIVMVGGRIGKDGIHGATFSSVELNETSPTSAVQIGDPITQKKMSDFLIEARDLGLYQGITDNGAGGLSSSLGEMATYSGGCKIYLDKCPLKYQGLMPWEILLSEAQERMSLSVAPEKVQELIELGKKRGVEVTAIGEFTDSGYYTAYYNDKVVAMLDMEFLHEGLPKMILDAKWQPPVFAEPDLNKLTDSQETTLVKMLSRLNIASKEKWVRQYDHEVQALTVGKPFVGAFNDGPADAGVVKPLFDSYEGLVISHGLMPRYSDIDTYDMVACCVDEAVRNIVACGGDPDRIVGLDNFCWPDPVKSESCPDGEYKLAQLVRANKALYDYCKIFNAPCISGKDSMKNDFKIGDKKISIPPTLLYTAVGKIDDVRKSISMDAKKANDLIYIVGLTRNELGASEYYASLGYIGNNVPKVDGEAALKTYRAMYNCAQQGLIASCHDLSDGGLAVALAETLFAGYFGGTVDLTLIPAEANMNDTQILYSESQSRFIVTVSPQNAAAFESALKGNAVFAQIGTVTEAKTLNIKGINNEPIINVEISKLKDAFQKPLNSI